MPELCRRLLFLQLIIGGYKGFMTSSGNLVPLTDITFLSRVFVLIMHWNLFKFHCSSDVQEKYFKYA